MTMEIGAAPPGHKSRLACLLHHTWC
jgi:hypothetical protein